MLVAFQELEKGVDQNEILKNLLASGLKVLQKKLRINSKALVTAITKASNPVCTGIQRSTNIVRVIMRVSMGVCRSMNGHHPAIGAFSSDTLKNRGRGRAKRVGLSLS